MDFERTLSLYIDNKPVRHGQKLMLVARLMQNPTGESAELLRTEFRELVEASFDDMCREAGVKSPPLNFQSISDSLMKEEKALIRAGEYQELLAALVTAEVSEEQFKDEGWLAEELAKHFSAEEDLDEEEKPEKINEMVQEIRDGLEYGEHWPNCCQADFDFDGAEYSVIRSEEMAEKIAINYVRDMLDHEPEMFSWNWLSQHIYVSDLDKRMIATDDADVYIGDMSDDDLLSDSQWGPDESVREQIEKLQEENPKQATEMIQKVREEAEEKYSDHMIERMTNDLTGFLEDLGYDLKDPQLLHNATWIQIDTEEAAKDAVNVDGWAHFLSHYDGEYTEISDGMVLFRRN
jgi:hypothetical protein